MAIAALVQAKGVPLVEVAEPAIIVPGQWQALAAEVVTGPSGRVRLHVQEAADVAKVRELLYERLVRRVSTRSPSRCRSSSLARSPSD